MSRWRRISKARQISWWSKFLNCATWIWGWEWERDSLLSIPSRKGLEMLGIETKFFLQLDPEAESSHDSTWRQQTRSQDYHQGRSPIWIQSQCAQDDPDNPQECCHCVCPWLVVDSMQSHTYKHSINIFKTQSRRACNIVWLLKANEWEDKILQRGR